MLSYDTTHLKLTNMPRHCHPLYSACIVAGLAAAVCAPGALAAPGTAPLRHCLPPLAARTVGCLPNGSTGRAQPATTDEGSRGASGGCGAAYLTTSEGTRVLARKSSPAAASRRAGLGFVALMHSRSGAQLVPLLLAGLTQCSETAAALVRAAELVVVGEPQQRARALAAVSACRCGALVRWATQGAGAGMSSRDCTSFCDDFTCSFSSLLV